MYTLPVSSSITIHHTVVWSGSDDLLLFVQRKSRRYYPTRLAITLATGVATASSNAAAGDSGFIVVETNYRIYAYTGADTQCPEIHSFIQAPTGQGEAETC